MAIVDEILSPLLTPFILYFTLRDKAGTIVDFLRNFTIEVSGVGDVCSFAEMNVRKHGSPEVRVCGGEGRVLSVGGGPDKCVCRWGGDCMYTV